MTDALIFMKWTQGEQELKHAIELMPQSAISHQWMGLTMMAQGQFDGSIAELRAADDLDPLSAAASVSVGLAYYMARRYDDALKQFEKVRRLHPDRGAIHPFIGAAYEAKGEFDKAMAEYQLALTSAPAGVRVRIAHLDAVMGKSEEARNLLKILEHPGAGDIGPSAFDLAAIYGALGEKDKAFQSLQRAYDDRIAWLFKVHPALDPLRGDPRYRKLVAEAGF